MGIWRDAICKRLGGSLRSAKSAEEEGRADTARRGRKGRLPVFAIVLLDILCVGIVLVVFALFHHVLPRPGKAIASAVAAQMYAPVTPLGGGTQPASAGEPERLTPTPESTPNPTPTPTPALGDFSAAFPTYDTGAGALHSYQGENCRIAITKAQENGVTYFVADVWIRSIWEFSTAFAKNQYGTGINQQPIAMAEDHGAIFAVTGDYYGARKKGVVIRNGDLYRDSVNSDVCVLYANGELQTYSQDEFDIQGVMERGAWQAWGFGPKLLDNGLAIASFESAIKEKNPRNAIGYYEPGHYCFITVDGRQKGYSVGMTLSELADTFSGLGCKAAFNLDGGATAEMVFDGQLVNKPYKGGRRSSDVICFTAGH